MGNKVKADQNGAQDRGVAVSGSNNTLLSGGSATLTGVGGNVAINNGITGDQFSDIIGQITQPSSAQVQSATPPAVTPPAASATATDPEAAAKKKKLVLLALALAAGVFVMFLIRSFTRK